MLLVVALDRLRTAAMRRICFAAARRLSLEATPVAFVSVAIGRVNALARLGAGAGLSFGRRSGRRGADPCPLVVTQSFAPARALVETLLVFVLHTRSE